MSPRDDLYARLKAQFRESRERLYGGLAGELVHDAWDCVCRNCWNPVEPDHWVEEVQLFWDPDAIEKERVVYCLKCEPTDRSRTHNGTPAPPMECNPISRE